MQSPQCSCHGEAMLWNKDARRKAGGYWKCRVKYRAARARYNESEKGRATSAAYERRETTRERKRTGSRRYYRDNRDAVRVRRIAKGGRGIAAAEAGSAPECACHKQPMRWQRHAFHSRGGYWTCAVKSRELTNAWRKKKLATDPGWREAKNAQNRVSALDDATIERRRRRKRDKYRLDEHHADAARERSRERYWSMTGFEYNKELLRKRRAKALVRMEKRHERLDQMRAEAI